MKDKGEAKLSGVGCAMQSEVGEYPSKKNRGGDTSVEVTTAMLESSNRHNTEVPLLATIAE